jgi:hypothetical protein
MSPKGPYKLVTVNTAPERAKRLIGRVVEALKDQYTIQHVANCESKSSSSVQTETRQACLMALKHFPGRSLPVCELKLANMMT